MNLDSTLSQPLTIHRIRCIHIIRDETRSQKRYVIAFGLLLNLLIINDLIRMLFGSSSSIAIVQYLTYGIVLLFSVIYFLKSQQIKSKQAITASLAILLVLILLSIFILRDYKFISSQYFPVLLSRCLPGFLLIMLIDGSLANKLVKNLNKYRFLWIVYAVVGTIFISRNTVEWGQYAGNFGFNLLLPFCLCFYNFLRTVRDLQLTKKSLRERRKTLVGEIIKWVLYSILILGFIVLRGSRTALLCSAFFVLISFFFSGIVSKKIRRIIFVILLVLVVFSTVLLRPLAIMLASMFTSSRTLQLLLSGFSFNSGRTEIKQIFIQGINEDLFAFKGLFSDRYYYASHTNTILDMTSYPHNFFIEVLYQFGVVFGFVFFLLLFVLTFRSLRILSNKRFRNFDLSFLFMFFFVSGVLRLLFSSSYLTTYEFFMFVGLGLKINILASQRFVKIKRIRA